MNGLRYLAEANLYLCIFYAGYRLLLQRETFYQLSRIYLLFTATVSFVIPLVQIGILKPSVSYPEIVVLHRQLSGSAPAVLPRFEWQQAVFITYLLGALAGAILLVTKLISLYRFSRKGIRVSGDGCNLVRLAELDSAFSFFNYLFIGEAVAGEETVIRHEMVHIRQKHSADVIFIELLKVICWFNPVIYLLRNSLKAVHEYIADAQTAGSRGNSLQYAEFLVSRAYCGVAPAITHSFFNKNLLKNRIMKLHQKPSGKLARLKYLVLLPLCAGLLCMSTLAFSKSYGWINLTQQRIIIPPPQVQKTMGDTNKNITRADARYQNSDITSKGYHYRESGYLVNGKTNFRLIIISKDGNEQAWFRNSCSPADLKMLKDKYGYTFPDMDLFNRMPPPPPMPIRPEQVKKLPPPPPPIPPARHSRTRLHKKLPPPPVKPDSI